jgi:hypothetical protein
MLMRGRGLGWIVIGTMVGLLAGPAARAQTGPAMPRAVVTLYRIAPAKHPEFLKWMVDREAIGKEVGAPAGQWYVHLDGDAWDFMVITPQLEGAAEAELNKKVEAAARKKGLAAGPKGAIQLRQFIAWHTDTMAAGPLTAAQLLQSIQ